jgi:hypothetical protein
LSPRYRLDDESPWLVGIDPSRHYWIQVNGNSNLTIVIPGLLISSMDEMKRVMKQFRSLQPGEQMILERVANTCKIFCVSSNCYAIETEINHAQVWHLFDEETLDSLLMSAHPDWQCAADDIELGRKLLIRSLQQATAVKS